MEVVNVELTKELKEKLKGTLGFKVETPFIYVPKVYRENDIPKELWCRCLLKSKNGIEIAEIEDNTGYMSYDEGGKNDRVKMHMESGSTRLNTLRKGLLKLKKFMMEDGSFVDWESGTKDMVITDSEGNEKTRNNIKVDKVLELMPVKFQVELQNAINERTVLTKEELSGLE